MVEQDKYGSTHRLILSPAESATPILASQLADAWVQVSQEVPSAATGLRDAIRSFLSFLERQPSMVGSQRRMRLEFLRRRHLDAWESYLQSAHEHAGSDTNYRRAVYLFALLKRIEEDTPGTIHEDICVRLEQPSRLRHVRNPGIPGVTPAEARQLRSAAHRVAYRFMSKSSTSRLNKDVLVAFHVLLSLSTGEPPEVLRRLTLADISASSSGAVEKYVARMSPHGRLTWLAVNDEIEQLAVVYTKNRAGGERREEVYFRSRSGPYRVFVDLLKATASLRTPESPDSLWLYRGQKETIRQADWSRPAWSLSRWCPRQGVHIDGPVMYQRLRKAVIAREVQQQGAVYLRRQTRHSSEVFFQHYSQTALVRSHAGRLLVDTIDKYFTAAQAGPTVITPEAQTHLTDRRGERSPLHEVWEKSAHGPHTACIDPTDSPYEAPGNVCGRSMTGTCFGCENAIITQDHLPAALRIAQVADPAKSADPELWQRNWKDIYELITEVIIPAFPVEAVREAQTLVGDVPVDLGVANDMRGPS